MKEMDVGQVVDFVIEYNEFHKGDYEEADTQDTRKATQSDWDSLFG